MKRRVREEQAVMSAIDRFGEPTQLPVSPSYTRWTGGSFRLLALQQWSEDPLLFSFPYRTLTRAGLSALPLDLCEQLPRLRVLWVDTHQGEKLEVQNLIHTTQLRRLVPPPKESMNLHNHISVKSNQYRKLLSCRVAFLTELTIISHTINPQLVTVYCVCVAGSFLTTR